MKSILPVFMVGLLAASALAEEPTLQTDILTRPRLTGDWGGLRSSLEDNGVSFEAEHTLTYQGLVSGTGSDDFEIGSKFDAFINLDSGKLGLWEGGGFRSHIEYRHGDADAYRGGAIWPVNTAQALPLGASEEIHASSLYFTQKMDGVGSILLGKINVVDLLAANSFFGGWGNRRFMNVAFVAPPSGLLPPVIFGAVANIETGPVTWTIMGYDPNDRTTEYLPDDLFSDGLNISLSGTYTGTLAGRMTKYNLGAIYSTKESEDLSDILLPPDLETPPKNSSFNISFQFSHYLQESADNPGDGWGVFLKSGITDGNPNPIQAYVIGGIGGNALFVGRPQDSFGLGYFYYAFSNDLRDALNPTIDFDDEQGLEVFYNYAITPWFKITGDIQYINPSSGGNDHALLLGLRFNTLF